MKGKRHIKIGGKIKMWASLLHINKDAPSYTLHTHVWASPYLATSMPQYVAQDSTYLSLATPIRGMYLEHTIPFKGWNHLIRYLANPLWSLETLAHAKAQYERACHYEVPTLLSMICKLFYPIILMTGCTGSLGDALDLTQDYRWFPFGFSLPIWDPNP